MASNVIRSSPSSTIDQQLATLRDSPVNNDGASDAVLSDIFTYLMGVPPSPSDGCLHWFCDRATSTTVGAATFLIRLFAYNSPVIEQWKTKFRFCLNGCSECVKGLQEAKFTSKTTYFGAFNADILKGFYESFEAWELSTVLEDLSGQPIAAAPPAIGYRIVSNLTILKDPQILSIIRSAPPSGPLHGWPSDPLPPGMFILLMDQDSGVRKWAESQASECKLIPIPRNTFTTSHVAALEALLATLDPISKSERTDLPTPFTLAGDPIILWSGFWSVLKLIPVESLKSGVIRRIVSGHLHDSGPQFVYILYCFEHLISSLGRSFWVDEGPEYPQIIFDSVKENSSFLELLLQPPESCTHPLLSWCSGYVHSIVGHPALAEVLAKIADFMCEELQHERFGEARPAIMFSAIKLLSGFYRQKDFPLVALSKAMDIHATTVVAVAFDHSYNTAAWRSTVSAARGLIGIILAHDIDVIASGITSLWRALALKKPILDADANDIALMSRAQVWRMTYRSLSTSDAAGIAMILSVVARSAHLDTLNPNPFNLEEAEQIWVNRAMPMVWNGFRDAFTSYVERSRSSSLLEVLQRPGVVQDVFVLLLSPREDIQRSAQDLVGLAFDVDGRLDCYRALLENFPDGALEGIFSALATFTHYAIAAPEACSLAKHLVSYLTDVIDVLCSRPDGLLLNSHFLRPRDKDGPSSRILELWKQMNKAIAVIFKRTPAWSVFEDQENITIWMRDALIYGRDLLSHLRVFETAANARQDVREDPGHLSRVGKQMVGDLQLVLPELTKWLRLTNEELLYQTFEILQSLLITFHDTRVPPAEASLQKLTKHIQDARLDNSKSRLDSSRLARLQTTILLFLPDAEVSSKVRDKAQPKGQVVVKESMTLRQVEDSKMSAPSGRTATESRFFTAHDQQKLDAVDSFPTYRRNATGPSKSSLPVRPAVSTHSRKEQSPSDSSSEEESQGTLAGLSNMQRSPKIKQQPTRRTIMTFDATSHKNPIFERLKKQAEETKKYQRLKPDLSGLYKTILSWKYHHDGAHPPGPQLTLSQVPADRFVDYAHYRRIFEPLLLLECWAQISQSKEEVGESYRCKINDRQFIDEWVDLDITFVGSVKKDWRLTESDVVLLQEGQLSILGKVQSYKTPMGRAIEARVRCVHKLDPGLTLGTEWQLIQVFSLSTINREYSALQGLPYYDLCPSILKPSLPPIPKLTQEAVKKVMDLYRVNEPQAIAISSCLQTNGFSLIQGPPGTGKTSTIVALVMAFIARRPRAIPIHVGKNGQSEPPTGPQILICAPSNAAIDEIAHRIRDSAPFRDNGKKVVRLGTLKSMNQNIADISLDQLVDNKLDLSKDTGAAAELLTVKEELETVKTQRHMKLQELEATRDNTSRVALLEDEIKRLNAKRTTLVKRYDDAKDNRTKLSRGLDTSRRLFRLQVLQSAHVICATLSGSGSDILQDLEIDVVIIDEASQAIELSALIPLKYQPKHSVLVGDPQQLPPTVLSQEASRFRYNESLFVRLQKTSPQSMHLLSIQYRMHPTISKLPSSLFYQGRLKDGPGMSEKTIQPWHSDRKFGVYRFFDIKSVEEKSGRSIRNLSECRVAVSLFARLRKAFSSIDFDGRVGGMLW
ncbi:SEN1 N terminal-domain-containing protein [Mycena sp. CBHHK59/15]|nr:SEN1 N terminal-domain-containing protein [Mycena sp. CBHHK59/15]